MSHDLPNSGQDIASSKEDFNRFFKNDLYGRFDSDENIILSRGGWQDEVVALPKAFRYCIDQTLNRHWIGYSDSLGHETVFESLKQLTNIGRKGAKYDERNFALTLGNVATIGHVFRLLKEKMPDSDVLAMSPYYPPILKSVNNHFENIEMVSSLESEDEILMNIAKTIEKNHRLKIFFLSNCIGVEGRIYTVDFWQKICNLLEEKDGYLVIDEGLWFDSLEYPQDIYNDKTVRIVTTSKKYGNPGMKTGFMLGPESFIRDYYEHASTNYGGPASMFFLLSEFLYQFEYAYFTEQRGSILRLADAYGIPPEEIEELYDDYVSTVQKNRNTFEQNRGVFAAWLAENIEMFDEAYIFQGINILMKPKGGQKAYDLFGDLMQGQKVSVLPSSCLGDREDKMFRVTILEARDKLEEGLKRISHHLRSK